MNFLRKIIKKFDGTFDSFKFEGQFTDQQLSGIIQLNTRLQKILLLIYLAAIISNVYYGHWIQVSLIFILGILSLISMKFFQQRPSFRCLTLMNATNIVIAIYRCYTSFQRDANQFVDYNDEFVRGAGLFAVHLSLLVNPRLSTNICIILIIVVINITVLSLNSGGFFYFGLGIVPCISVYLSKLQIDIQTRRKLFRLQQQNFEWGNNSCFIKGNIIQLLIDYPYLIMSFNQYDNKFELISANSYSIKQLNVHDSVTMRQLLRDMVLFSQKGSKLETFESHILRLITRLDVSAIDGSNQITVSLKKVKHVAQIFNMDIQGKIFLITLKNMNLKLFQQNSSRIIINQQIATCREANYQFKFCKLINNLIKTGDKLQSFNFIKRNILHISNQAGIYATKKQIKIQSFNITTQIRYLSKLFPRVQFYFNLNEQICNSDPKIFRSMMFNIFSIYQNFQKVFIDVKSDNDVYHIHIYARPFLQSTFRLLKLINETEIDIFLQEYNHKPIQLALFLFKKDLSILSPHQKLELKFENRIGIKSYLLKPHLAQIFKFTKICLWQINYLLISEHFLCINKKIIYFERFFSRSLQSYINYSNTLLLSY